MPHVLLVELQRSLELRSILRVLLCLSCCGQKPQVLAEGAVPAGDLSEEVDEAQSCGNRPPGEEEEGYDADSESNPGDMAKQEEGRPTQIEHVSQLLMSAGSCWPFRNRPSSSDGGVY